MSYSGDAEEQVVRMTLEGDEVTIITVQRARQAVILQCAAPEARKNNAEMI